MNGPSIPLVKRVDPRRQASDGRALVERLLALTTADDIEREVESRDGAALSGPARAQDAVGSRPVAQDESGAARRDAPPPCSTDVPADRVTSDPPARGPPLEGPT